MIKHIDALLISWAEQTAGGVGVIGSCGGFGGTAITRPHKRRAINHGDACGERLPELTARGCETRVTKRASVSMSTVALDVDRAVAALPGELKEAVRVFYKEGGLALKVRAARLGVSVVTMYKRISLAHLQVDSHLYGRRVA